LLLIVVSLSLWTKFTTHMVCVVVDESPTR
jgi:hypothetical protein